MLVSSAVRFVVPQSDPREGLRGQLGLKAIKRIGTGQIIGPYRSHVMLSSEYRASKAHLPRGWMAKQQLASKTGRKQC